MFWALFALVTFVVLPALAALQLGRTVRRSSVERLAEFALPTTTANHLISFDAHRAVEDLETAGFARTGAVRWAMPTENVVFSVLHGPEQRTYAVVTPQHLTFISDYNGKSMLTSTSSQAAPASFELSQGFPEATTDQLLHHHRVAIERVRSLSGRLARRLDPREIIDLHMRSEMYGVTTFSVLAEIKAAVTNSFRQGRRNPLGRQAEDSIHQWLSSDASYHLA